MAGCHVCNLRVLRQRRGGSVDLFVSPALLALYLHASWFHCSGLAAHYVFEWMACTCVQIVYRAGSKSSDAFVVLSGGVKIVIDGVSVSFLSDRDVFGHVEVALAHSRRLTSAIASEPTRIIRIPRQVSYTNPL